jgi:hypothetical protein
VHARVVRAFAQLGHWLGPVTRPGWLGLVRTQPQTNKKIKSCTCINKRNININLLFFYSFTLESGIKNTDSNLFHCILFCYIKIKKLCMHKNKLILFFYSLTLESGIKNIDLNLFYFYSYVIFTNARVEIIHS